MSESKVMLGALVADLVDGAVDFVVVGTSAAVLQGAPLTSDTVEIVVDVESPENLARLREVLEQLGAILRGADGPPVPADVAALRRGESLALFTGRGAIDCLAALPDGRRYAELRSLADELVDGERSVAVLDLATLIELRVNGGRPRDRQDVPILLAALARKPAPSAA